MPLCASEDKAWMYYCRLFLDESESGTRIMFSSAAMVPLAMESPMRARRPLFLLLLLLLIRGSFRVLQFLLLLLRRRDERRMILAPIQFISSPSLEADDDDALPIARRIFPERVVKILPSFLPFDPSFVCPEAVPPPSDRVEWFSSVGRTLHF